jgi:hypothetical protein
LKKEQRTFFIRLRALPPLKPTMPPASIPVYTQLSQFFRRLWLALREGSAKLLDNDSKTVCV